MAGSSPAAVDKNTLKRMQNIQQLEQKDRQTITSVIDAFIRDAKARKAYGKIRCSLWRLFVIINQ